MATTVADLLVERLIDWNVNTIFGFPGDGINGICEALRTRQDKIKFIQVRHEEAAAFAACGYAKYTGRLGVCMATSGPGGIHLLNGLYDAKCDGQPVLAITGHTFHDLIGTQYQQDVDLTKLFMDVAVYNERLTGPAHVHNAMDDAIRTAMSHRGVAHLCVPKDIQDWKSSDFPPTKANIRGHSRDQAAATPQAPAREDLQAAAEIINRGKKVAILAGRGALNCRDLVLELAEKAAAPVAKALLGKAVLPDDSPYTTGGIGLLGTAPSQDMMRTCDTLIIVGSGFPYMEFYPKPGQDKCVQIDIDASRIGLRHPVDVGLAGDCQHILQTLLPLIQRKSDRSFLETAQKSMQGWNELLLGRANRMDKPLKPQVVTHTLNKFLTADAVIASDCGTVTTWAARYIRIREGMHFSASGMLATMGNGLPYAIGAAVAYPGRQVVAVVGDGGLTMLLGEIATLVKHKLPVKVIVIKNNTLGQIKWEQMVFEGNPQFGVDLQPIDFAAFARACGAGGFTVDDPTKVEQVLAEAFAHPGPALVQAVVDPNEPAMPGHATLDQAWHFAKALMRGEKYSKQIIKTVLEDTVREIIQRRHERRRWFPRLLARREFSTSAEARNRMLRSDQVDMAIRDLRVSAYRIPTDRPEADGTIAWDHTTLVCVHARAGNAIGLGYTYADVSTARLIHDVLAPVVQGRDAFAVPAAWMAMVRSIRNLGRPGICSMGIAAVDVALWDLKARLLDLPLLTLLGAARQRVPVYGSGGFTSYTIEQLQQQLAGWAADGIPRVKMKIGTQPGQDPERVQAAREAIGADVELFVDANGAYDRKQALAFAERFADLDVCWFEEPVSSDDLQGLRLLRDQGPSGMDIAAGEYGYDLPYFRRMLEAGAVDVLQADASRCAGITGFLQTAALCSARSLPLSAHCAPSLHAHVCCAALPLRHLEYFHDHARIEQMLFDGFRAPVEGALVPDLSRPGMGLELKVADARSFAVWTSPDTTQS